MGEAFEIAGLAGPICVMDTNPAGGDDEPILLIHGINMAQDVWADVIAILGRSRRVVSFDLRGHGRSGKTGPFTADDYADDALSVLDKLGIARAHIVGVSFGGSAAFALAVKSPTRVATVASFGGALTIKGFDIDGMTALISSVGVRAFFSSFLPGGSFPPDTCQTLIDRAVDAACIGRSLETVIAIITAAVSEDTTAVASAVTAPALVATGELDMTCPVESGRAVAAALRAELVVLAGQGHLLPMEVPEQVAALIEQHTNGHAFH